MASPAGALLPAPPHPISVTEAVVYVQRHQVSLSVTVFVEDLYLFHELKPNAEGLLSVADIQRGIELHKPFLLKGFQIRDVEGNLLQGKFVDVKTFAWKPEGVPMGELMEHTLTFQYEFPLSDVPEFFTFSQRFVDESAGIPVEVKMRVKQEGGESSFQCILTSDSFETMRFSWDNPPLSLEASEKEWEEWIARQEDETLGITSYSSVYSFIYITAEEVRHEILVPLLMLEHAIVIPRDQDAFLDLDEQQQVRERIAEYFAEGNPVEIDGKQVQALVDRVDFYGLQFKDFAVRAEPQRVSLASARVGIILSYPTDREPTSVSVTWDRFDSNIWTVKSSIYAFDDFQRWTFTRLGKLATFAWTSPGPRAQPTIQPVEAEVDSARSPRVERTVVWALGCLAGLAVLGGVWSPRAVRRGLIIVGMILALLTGVAWAASLPASIEPEQAISVMRELQENTYRAFHYRSETDVYEALSQSVDGPLLPDLYLEIQKSREMAEQGGAISKIEEVQWVAGELLPKSRRIPQGFVIQCTWKVKGTVEHWGHIHSRTNQYQAEFEVRQRDGLWKIVQATLLEQQRVNFETRVRRML